MDLSTALEIIKKNLKNEIFETKHFQEQCEARKLSDVLRIIRENKILGIVEQDECLYKIWFYFKKDKDLNIVIRILSNGDLEFITIYPCQSYRRKR